MKNSTCTILLAFLLYSLVFVSCSKDTSKLSPTNTALNAANSLKVAPIFLKRADTLFSSITELYLNGMPRDIWSTNYPRTDGYWDGAAVIWGHGAAFSGYTAIKEAAEGFPDYKSKYESNYDNRLLTAIDQFRNTRNGGAEAYAVYPGEGDERYFDDNIWVGIDMVDLYMLTNDSKYLDRAKLVWNFILTGTDDIMGGGVYWKEGLKSKHTCSTAPAAVLAAKLYEATQETPYLQSAKDLYAWCKETLQDPNDYLYWDNARLADENDPNSEILIAKEKYSYNSGQPMQAASLLYKITHEAQYLTDAQNIAGAAYNKWFIPFNSAVLGESFQILEPGHVWFQAIMFRGFIELYKLNNDRTYVTAYEKTLTHAWLSDCRNPGINLLNGDFRGGTTQTSWEILHEGACLEMLARLAALERDGL
ncbi:glycoside hydrolase family 76 protein [Olivibacter domesticus]|uniref:Glycosyl hydrolase family 76 n=1 Tax=Olivibacter domesticus TaxID=407022 RepID=A0A1H7HHZ4_OLID1|nr:glycoside hydrolase family 76 protein [Olivibacter domesticus]SEK49788.1 Glycosyl hydrolase family 76 [Olivibacter domesticus]